MVDDYGKNRRLKIKAERRTAQKEKAARALEKGRRIELKECWWCGNMFRGLAIQRYCHNACKCKAYRYRKETGEAWQN